MLKVTLRPIDKQDLPLLLAWAWIPEIWEYMPTSRRGEKLTWRDHLRWWESREQREDWLIIVDTDYYPRPVGVVHISKIKSSWPEIGFYVAEIPLWGSGIGKDALRFAMELALHRGIKCLRATIHPDNKRSVRLFKSLGFKKVDEARKGQHRYEYTLGGPEITIPIYKIGHKRSYRPVPA